MKKPRKQEISLTKSKQLSLLQLPSIPYPGSAVFISATPPRHHSRRRRRRQQLLLGESRSTAATSDLKGGNV
jgi:hypothetical protein